MGLSEKAKTSYEIFLLWNDKVDKSKWVPLETAQQLEKVIGQYETALQKITAIAEEDEAKIAKIKEMVKNLPIPYHIYSSTDDFLEGLRGCLAGEQTK